MSIFFLSQALPIVTKPLSEAKKGAGGVGIGGSRFSLAEAGLDK